MTFKDRENKFAEHWLVFVTRHVMPCLLGATRVRYWALREENFEIRLNFEAPKITAQA